MRELFNAKLSVIATVAMLIIAICIVALAGGYRVSIDANNGFVFEPALRAQIETTSGAKLTHESRPEGGATVR